MNYGSDSVQEDLAIVYRVELTSLSVTRSESTGTGEGEQIGHKHRIRAQVLVNECSLVRAESRTHL